MQPSDRMLMEAEQENMKLEQECNRLGDEVAALRLKLQTAQLEALNNYAAFEIAQTEGNKFMAERDALRAEVETLRKENEILNAFKKTIARFEREAAEKKHSAQKE